MKRTLLLAVSLTLLFASASTSAEKRLALPFRQGLEMLLENSTEVRIERLSPRIAGARVVSEEGAFDPELFGSFTRTDTSTPLSARSSVAAGGRTSIESEAYTFNAGITGKTQWGTELTLEARNDWTADTFSGFDFEYESFTGVKLTQPVLRGYGKDSSMQAINIARKDREISAHRFRLRMTELVDSYAQAYWDLFRAIEEVKVRRESLALAETLLGVSRKKLEAGSISRLELVQAEAAVAARNEELILSGKTLLDAEKRLKDLISGDKAYEMREIEVVPQPYETPRPSTRSLEESMAKAVEKRPDYLEAKSGIERNNIRLRYASNQAWPKVDLEASYGYNGLGGSFKESYDGLSDNPEWSLGVNLSYPLGNRRASGALAATRLETDQSVLRLKRLEQEMVLTLDNARKGLASDESRVEAAEVAVRLAEETLDAEEKKLEAGRSTTFNVLRIQEDLARARLKMIESKAGLNKSLIGFYRERGTLLEDLGVEVREENGVTR